MRKFFVTGGAGFIGSAFIRLLLDESPDCLVTNFDALTYAGNLDNLSGLEGDTRHRFVRGDICDRALVLSALEEGTEAIVTSPPSRTSIGASPRPASSFAPTSWARRFSSTRRVSAASKDRAGLDRRVMGSLPDDDHAFFTEASPFDRTAPTRPRRPRRTLRPRGRSTRTARHVVTRCGKQLRAAPVPRKISALIISNAMRRRTAPRYGDGRYTRDWNLRRRPLPRRPHGDAKGRSGAAYNIGARNERRNLEVADSVLRKIGKRSRSPHVKDPPRPRPPLRD